MSDKTIIFIGMTVGSIVGGYLPTLFGVDVFSFTSILTSGVGAILGIWVAYRLINY